MKQQTKIIQITAGRGPMECCRVVAKVMDLVLKDALKNKINTQVLNTTKGEMNGTYYSATIKVGGKNITLISRKLTLLEWKEGFKLKKKKKEKIKKKIKKKKKKISKKRKILAKKNWRC